MLRQLVVLGEIWRIGEDSGGFWRILEKSGGFRRNWEKSGTLGRIQVFTNKLFRELSLLQQPWDLRTEQKQNRIFCTKLLS